MKSLKKISLVLIVLFSLASSDCKAQIDTTFWFAAPWVTPDHADNVPMAFLFSTFGNSTTIRLRQPAGTYDTTFTVAPNSLFSKEMTHILNELETKPANTVLTSGFEITSDFPIIVVYDFLSSSNNPETYSLKGQNGIGYEFVAPFQTKWRNQNVTPINPKQQINITATEDNTTIYITPKCAVVGHPANVTYSVFLPFAGSSYTCENMVMNTNVPGNNLAGTIVVSDKKIAVTCSDDSVRSSGGGCYDLMGDQIVPVDVIGTDYVVAKGFLNVAGDESFFVVATENFTTVTIDDGVTISSHILNQGDTYAHSVTERLTYITSDKNVYLLHATGYGCEMGEALIPPLNCAGSEQVSFTRNKSQPFFLTITCPAGAQFNFTLNGSTTAIDPLDFVPVPGTGGAYVGDTIEFSTAQIAVNSSNLLTNSSDFFSMGVFNGGATGGVLYHYLSSFLRRVTVDAGTDQTLCNAETSIDLSGAVSGGTITGEWSVLNGLGTLNSPTNLTTTYDIVQSDIDQGSLTFVLASTGNCDPKYDTLKVDFIESPDVTVGTSSSYCKNNVGPIPITGIKDFATGSEWSGGIGGAIANSGNLNTTYTPSPTDLANDSVVLYLESVGSLFGCPEDIDSLIIYFTEPPSVSAGADQVTCSSIDSVIINGTVTGITNTGVWTTDGTGAFDPDEFNLGNNYFLSATDDNVGSVLLTLTSTNNGNCLAVSDNITVTILENPVVEITSEDSLCANLNTLPMSGTVTSGFTTNWVVNGSGSVASPGSLTTNYSIVPADVVSGFMDVFLETNGGICPVEQDSMRIIFVQPPVVDAGIDQAYCSNELVELNGVIAGTASSATWTSTGTGDYIPSSTSLSTFYEPSPLDISNGSVTFTLTSSADFGCNPDNDDIIVTYKAIPEADFSFNSSCEGDQINFTDLSTTTDGTINTWEYDFGDNITSITSDPIHTYVGSGSFDISLVASSSNGCSDTIVKSVFINPIPVVNFSASNACVNGEVFFIDQTFLANGNITSWEWDFENGTELSNIQNPSNYFYNSGVVPVSLTVTSDSSCVGVLIQNIDVLEGPTAEFSITPANAFVLEDVFFTDESTNGPITDWLWDFGDGSGGFNQNEIYQYADGGTYTVLLKVTDEVGCEDTISKSILVGLPPALPSGFTPNGDGENDVFIIRGGPFDAVDFKIYNNWGQLIFESNDAAIGWDGTYNNDIAPIGVYTWTYTVIIGETVITKEGDVTLMR